ncbi:hypothetical protein ACFE04_031416 [Oxalis oulophora]
MSCSRFLLPQRLIPKLHSTQTLIHKLKRRNHIIAAASVSGSGAADYNSEQLLDNVARKEKRKRKIAGIDQDELLDPSNLADSDSCFLEFNGVHIHYKVCNSSDDYSQANVPMVLLHGFGASLYSWNRVMKPLSLLVRAKVLAFDRPAFGLTSRLFPPFTKTKALNPYSMLFSVLATIHFIDVLAAQKAILVGHSAGSLVAVESYFEAPERVAALILVAPAIFAPLTLNKEKTDSLSGGGDESKLESIWKPFFMLLSKISNFIVQMLKGIRDMLNSLYKKVLSAILRSAVGVMLVRMAIDRFGIAAVRSSWWDPNQVTEHILQGYTKPLRAKGWDRALVEFTAATLINTETERKQPLGTRLNQIQCPVLIVTGDRDRIVPSWNAERLSRAIPGSKLAVINNCGHLPHEEKVEEFISIVDKFLQTALGNPESPAST